VYHSPQNNIATGRNLVLDNAQYSHIALIDDDETPVNEWLIELVKVMNTENCAVVTGPVFPVYPDNTSSVVRNVDLHHTMGRQTGDELRATGTGNVLIDTSRTGNIRFKEEYGRSGGSDTDFFMRVTDTAEKIIWASDAVLREKIESNRATVRFMMRRAISQGNTYRRILHERGDIESPFLFSLKSLVVVIVSLLTGTMFLVLRNHRSGNLLRRAFVNIGRLKSPSKHLYD